MFPRFRLATAITSLGERTARRAPIDSRRLGLIAISVSLMLTPGIAGATTFGFFRTTGHCATGEARRCMERTDLGADHAPLRFKSIGPSNASIADFYFGKDTILRLPKSNDFHSGVSFSKMAKLHRRPGSHSPFPFFRSKKGLMKIHLRGFGSGRIKSCLNSESVLNNVPEPSTGLLLGAGLAALTAAARRRR